MYDSFVIGISGSIASGKSMICHLLAMRGIFPLDADELTHYLLLKGKAGYSEVVRFWGNQFLEKNGDLNRSRLGQFVFNNPLELHKLENILHPLVSDSAQKIIENISCPIKILEAIKLYDSELIGFCDSRWFVTTVKELQLERLIKSRGMTKEDACERLMLQSFPTDMKIDNLIENSGKLIDIWEQITTIFVEMKRDVPGFEGICNKQQRMAPISMLDYLDLKDKREKWLEFRHMFSGFDDNDKTKISVEEFVQMKYFLTKLPAVENYLRFKFDHFNMIIDALPNVMDEDAILNGLDNIERLTNFWGGNSQIIILNNEQNSLKENLISNGYQDFSVFDYEEAPFLRFFRLKKGTIGNVLVKPLTDGMWRFIP